MIYIYIIVQGQMLLGRGNSHNLTKIWTFDFTMVIRRINNKHIMSIYTMYTGISGGGGVGVWDDGGFMGYILFFIICAQSFIINLNGQSYTISSECKTFWFCDLNFFCVFHYLQEQLHGILRYKTYLSNIFKHCSVSGYPSSKHQLR